jgi:hypothetical protein
MSSFKNPVYSKRKNANGAIEPIYTFGILYSDVDEYLTTTVDTNDANISQILYNSLLENSDWWKDFITIFIQSSSKHFTKQYTYETISKLIKHNINTSSLSYNENDLPILLTFIPVNIEFYSGNIYINWSIQYERLLINIPDLDNLEITEKTKDVAENNTIDDSDKTNPSVLPVSKNNSEIEEINPEQLDSNIQYTGEEISLDNPNRLYEKQRVKEARLKAKLAYYKAQRQMNEYYNKYGTDISDSESEEDSDSGDESD